MIEANRAVFACLEHHCAAREEPISTPGHARWIATSSRDKAFLKYAVITSDMVLRFGRRQGLAHFRFGQADYIAVVGFEFEPIASGLALAEASPGMLTAVLAELTPMPIASPAEIRNIVEAFSKEDPGYVGHAAADIAQLFPSISVVRIADLVDDEGVARIYLGVCAEECKRGSSWVDASLADQLATLTDLAVPQLPYLAICRALFDPDPRSLFMALYRCIEATYAYEATALVVADLDLPVVWHELAAVLERRVGWHPQEASSLNLVLRNAVVAELEGVCRCLDQVIGEDVCSSAGKALYALRNSIVHYRPGLDSDVLRRGIDWNELCSHLCGIVFEVFSRAYA